MVGHKISFSGFQRDKIGGKAAICEFFGLHKLDIPSHDVSELTQIAN